VIRLVDAEIFKLRSTRTFYGLMAGALGFTLVIGLLAALLDSETPKLSDLMMIAFFPQLIALVLGILAVTSEFRHGTITPSLLVSPWRARLMLSKLAATLIVTLALGLLVALLITAITAVAGGETDRAGALIAGCTLVTMLYAALGVGLGALVRNQVGALIGSLVYLLLLESLIGLIPGVKKVIPEYGITGAAAALSATDPSNRDLLDQLPGGLLLTGFAAIFLLAGIVMMQQRDVTA
jgi:ABC-2 type transport system permease protein